MTDARLPDKWLLDRRFLRLTANAYRGFCVALMWSVSNRTDGVIEKSDLALIAGFPAGAEDELVASGLWLESEPGWLIEPFAATQTGRSELEVLERVREAGRRKKQRQRAKAAGVDVPGDDVSGTVPGDITGVQSPGTTQARLGQASPVPSLLSLQQPPSVDRLASNPPSQEQLLPKSGTALGRSKNSLTVEINDEPVRVEIDTRNLVHENVPNAVLSARRVRDGLYGHTQLLLNDEADPRVVAVTLGEWARRTNCPPGDLPHIYADAIKRLNGRTYGREGAPQNTTLNKGADWRLLGRQADMDNPKEIT